jgi:hypothetical protein
VTITSLLNTRQEPEAASKEACLLLVKNLAIPRPSKYERKTRSTMNKDRVIEEHTLEKLAIQNLAVDFNLSMEDAEKIYSGQREIDKAKTVNKYKRGKPLMETKAEIRDWPIDICQLHEYYIFYTKVGVGGFEVTVPAGLVFNKQEEKHYVEYEALFQLF